MYLLLQVYTPSGTQVLRYMRRVLQSHCILLLAPGLAGSWCRDKIGCDRKHVSTREIPTVKAFSPIADAGIRPLPAAVAFANRLVRGRDQQCHMTSTSLSLADARKARACLSVSESTQMSRQNSRPTNGNIVQRSKWTVSPANSHHVGMYEGASSLSV